ncbi:putative serine-palmitoyl-CoA transferase [Trypanosoma conorhini]|uniref:serine C-palmitoyltransferase n=1 Tax=Trypanosoma conorhini TaxID=83891 RepID=A0A3R7P7X6_9TRYP|nr:putative serine-palmitoyl-CoA transferase [Trypanosoma conorhini]RNF18954.1 putative serine-palmitoyl-CoA transferase [Trypanosoma conorhini]
MAMNAVASLVLTQIVEHPFHFLLEIVFAAALAAVLWRQHVQRKKNKSKLVAPVMPPPEEQERRIAQFQSKMFQANCRTATNATVPNGAGMAEVDSREGCYVTIRNAADGGLLRCLDLATEDFHSFSTHPTVLKVARETVMAYGVGSCGPRGFYGTIKPHMDAETDLARFLGVEDAIICSLSFATVSTLISCFAGRGEYLIVDEGVNLSIADGCTLSRATVYKYRHNNMPHLESLLKEVAEKESATKKLSRRFVVTEGLFRNSGDLCHLPRILELCHKYKFRIILEDSYGFGCLGSTGRGTHEHFGIPATRIDLYVGSLSTSLGAVGGFCAGTRAVVDYQRLTASAYVFSASLPPYITAAVSTSLTLLDGDHTYAEKLQANAKLFRQTLRQASFNADKLRLLECEGDVSPILVLRPTDAYAKSHAQSLEVELEEVVRMAREKKVMLVRHLYSEDEQCENLPALRILVKGKATRGEIEGAANVVVEAVKAVFS